MLVSREKHRTEDRVISPSHLFHVNVTLYRKTPRDTNGTLPRRRAGANVSPRQTGLGLLYVSRGNFKSDSTPDRRSFGRCLHVCSLEQVAVRKCAEDDFVLGGGGVATHRCKSDDREMTFDEKDRRARRTQVSFTLSTLDIIRRRDKDGRGR